MFVFPTIQACHWQGTLRVRSVRIDEDENSVSDALTALREEYGDVEETPAVVKDESRTLTSTRFNEGTTTRTSCASCERPEDQSPEDETLQRDLPTFEPLATTPSMLQTFNHETPALRENRDGWSGDSNESFTNENTDGAVLWGG